MLILGEEVTPLVDSNGYQYLLDDKGTIIPSVGVKGFYLHQMMVYTFGDAYGRSYKDLIYKRGFDTDTVNSDRGRTTIILYWPSWYESFS